MNAHLVCDPRAGPEAAHYAAALAKWLEGRGWSYTLDYPEGSGLDAIIPRSEQDSGAGIRVVFSSDASRLDRGRFRVNISKVSREIPFAVAPWTFHCSARPPLDRPRLLIYGDVTATRRLRMSLKVIAELRYRHRQFAAVVRGTIPVEAVRTNPPDELHEDLSPTDLAHLVCSSSIILETSDQEEMLSPAYFIGISLGLPTICHRDAIGEPASAAIAVEEWSADAFADAITAVDPGVRRTADRSRIRNSLEMFEKVLLGAV